MNKEDRYLWLVLGFTFFSRLPFLAQIPYGLDSIQFVLAMDHFDVRLHQPHPPGYFLFVMLGRLVRQLTGDSNLSLIVISMVASVLAVGILYLLGKALFNSRIALIAAVFLATSPVFWFHGEVALSNALDCLAVCVVALLCWKSFQHSGACLSWAAFSLGLSGGIRQNTLVFLIPLGLLSAYSASWKRRILALLILGGTVCLWYIPMAQMSGGWEEYQQALRDHWLNANWRGIHWNWIQSNCRVVYRFLFMGLGPSILLILTAGLSISFTRQWKEVLRDARTGFLLSWIVPSLAFFVLIMSHPFQSGHSLIYLPAMILIAAISIHQLASLLAPINKDPASRPASVSPHLSRHYSRISIMLMVLVGVFNVVVFLDFKTQVSLQAIRGYEKEVADSISVVEHHCSPTQTLLVNYDYMQLGFRDFAYHLPEYLTIQAFPSSRGGQILTTASFNRKTLLLQEVEIPDSLQYFAIPGDLIRYLPVQPATVKMEGKMLKSESGYQLYVGNIAELPELLKQTRFHWIGKHKPGWN
jgi:hypothetical protein